MYINHTMYVVIVSFNFFLNLNNFLTVFTYIVKYSAFLIRYIER